jgi:transcriptional regulator with GAF, ATPase, and Fis domain
VARAAVPAATTFEAAREEFERRFVRAALASANGRRGRAAEALGVTRQGLAKMLRRLHIDPP